MAIIEEGIRVVAAKVGFDATYGKVHLRHLPCGRVRVLSKHRNVVDVTAVVFNKLRTLYEHTAGSAAGIYVPADFDTIENAFSGAKPPKKAYNKGLSRSVFDFESPFCLYSIGV